VTIAFFMPIPMWAERRLRAFGEPADKPSSALFAFRMLAEEGEQEIPFLREMLWLSPT
jgi:hypothetical protein